MLVVTNFLVLSAVTDVTKSPVVGVYPVTALAVPFAPTAVPLAVAFMFVVLGVTVVVKVAPVPSAVSVVCAPNPVIAFAVPSAPTATLVVVALNFVVVGLTVTVG